MHVAHIIPFLLNNFDDRVINSREIVRDTVLFSRLIHLRRQTDAARTWDMLQSWTLIDFKTLVGPNINSPTNAIYMNSEEHRIFGRFRFYLDKEAVSRLRDLFLPSLALIYSSTLIYPTSTKYVYPDPLRV